jgi:hypothetical protein
VEGSGAVDGGTAGQREGQTARQRDGGTALPSLIRKGGKEKASTAAVIPRSKATRDLLGGLR